MRILVISPHFPPTNAADMQRVRLLLPHLSAACIEAEVLAVEPEQVAAPCDPWLEEGLPDEVPIHRVTAMGLNWRRIPGLGTLGYRSLGALRHKGNALLGGSHFDLVYFSTTQFEVHLLGPEWKRRFGVPFVMDYQDPWVSDYYRDHPQQIPPGGRLKYALASSFARRQEPRVLRDCAGITSVSAAYPTQLAARYPWLRVRETGDSGQESEDSFPQPSTLDHQLRSLVLPFPGDAMDLERVRNSNIRQTIFDPHDGHRHWVYIGRGGADMAKAVKSLFLALQSTLDSQLSTLNSPRLHFIGTSYAAAGTGAKTIEPLAAEFGLAEIVSEHPDRIPYSQTLRCLLDADALIVPGSDDPGYTASKIYPYLLAGKPLLAIFHEQSSIVDLLRRVGGGQVVTFASGDSPAAIAARICSEALQADGTIRQVALDTAAFEAHTASHQALALAGFFRDCCQEGPIEEHR